MEENAMMIEEIGVMIIVTEVMEEIAMIIVTEVMVEIVTIIVIEVIEVEDVMTIPHHVVVVNTVLPAIQISASSLKDFLQIAAGKISKIHFEMLEKFALLMSEETEMEMITGLLNSNTQKT
jgi:hypothetical protein